ncbi:MAG: ethylbenzene dehydrogenase-related protein [bacterium]
MIKKWYVLIMLLAATALFLLPQQGYTQGYVGPDRCLDCHGDRLIKIRMDATGWETSMHANGYSYVPDSSHTMEILKGIIADYNQNGIDDFVEGLDFNNIFEGNPFDGYTNAPILGYSDATGYTITIGADTHRVYLTYGGSGLYKQRYVVKINTGEGETNDYYVSPIQFDEKTHEYVLYNVGDWYENKVPKVFATRVDAATKNSRSLAKECAGCHTTGLQVQQDANGEWIMSGAGVKDESKYADFNNIFDIDGDGDFDQINIGCERCHGPGARHADTTMAAIDIINPKTDLTTTQATNLCGMCHSRGKSLPNNTFSYPFNDTSLTSWSVGDLVTDFYTDGGGYWPDGSSSKHHQQFYDFRKSGKGDLSQPWRDVTCYDCHDVHNTEKHHMRTTIVEDGVEIPTENDNNTLCLACHATHGDFTDITLQMVADYASNVDTIAAAVRKHSNHFYDPTGTGASRCSKCHNPKIIKSAIHYDIHSHTFEALSPQKTLDLAMPNACAASCHVKEDYPNFGVDVSNDTLSVWSEAEDIALAKALLFWYDNMWFKQLGGEGKTVEAPELTTAPTVDGDTTDWAGVAWANDIPLAHNKMVSMKAAVTTTDIYFLFKWADPTLSMTRSGSWSYDGANWTKSAGQSEDRIALLWNISIPEADWDARGCMNKCHRDVDNTNAGNDTTTSEDDAFLPAGQKADMWHMKAARSLGAISASQTGPLTIDPATHEVTAGKVTLNGYIDDKYVGAYGAPPDGGRHGDAGTETYSHNRNAAKTAPKYIETDPTDYIDAMVLTQAEIDNGEAVLVADATANDLATYWAKYAGFNAVVPERILSAPTGSRADILQSATWENGVWYTEIKRPLNTGNDDDAQFTVGSFKFGIALMDNGGGAEHWTTGSVLNTLNISSITDVETRVIAGIPKEYALYQNYPNPFNPTTNIEFDVVKQGQVTLKVFNILGEEVATVVDKVMPAGRQRVTFDGASLASGVYFYRLEVNEFMATKKLLLLK